MLTDEEKLNVISFGYEESYEQMELVYPGDDDYNENLPVVPNGADEDAENGSTGNT